MQASYANHTFFNQPYQQVIQMVMYHLVVKHLHIILTSVKLFIKLKIQILN